MGEFVHVYNDGGGIRDVPILQGAGVVLGGKDRDPVNSSGPCSIAAIGTPFAILPGDGAAVGLQFTGTAGAFTLSAAILTNLWNVLKGCWIYLPANFGGSAYPSGWYWAVFSSDTAGIVYTDTYVSGKPVRPRSPVAFSIDLTGRLTSTTSEVTGPTGFVLRGGSMGPSGTLKSHIRLAGTTTGTKVFREYLDSAQIAGISPSTSPVVELITSCRNQASEQIQTSTPIASPTGVGIAGSSMGYTSTIDTAADRTFSISLQSGGNAHCAILLHADVTVTYGA